MDSLKVLNLLAKVRQQLNWKQLYFVFVSLSTVSYSLFQAFTLFCELFTIYGDFTVL